MTVKEVLLKAARSGDMDAHRRLVKDGVMYAEIFAPDTNKQSKSEINKAILDYSDDQFGLIVNEKEVSRIYFDDDVEEIGKAISKLCNELNIEVKSIQDGFIFE